MGNWKVCSREKKRVVEFMKVSGWSWETEEKQKTKNKWSWTDYAGSKTQVVVLMST